MSVTISTVNVGTTANDGTGDDIRDAFIKVNYSLGNLKTGIDTMSFGGANVLFAKVANLQVTDQVIGNLFLTGADTIYINGSPVATAGNAFTGGSVAGNVAFLNANAATSSSTGAVTITGGLGVGQNIYVAGIGVYTGNLVAASIVDASSITAAALISKGGLGVAKSAYIGQNFNVAGTTALSSTLSVTGVTSITNSTASTNISTGALLVSGGIGAAGNINAGGTQHNLSGNLTITGNLAVNGNLSFGTDTFRINDNIIDLHTNAANDPLTIDDGKDVGIRFHVYKPGYGDYHAFAGWANDSQSFEYYDRGVESGGVFVGNTYGIFKGGGFLSVNTTAATSTTTGAIRTSGGIAASGNIYAGGNVVVTANISSGNVSATKGTFTSIAGTLLTAAQTNITSVGTLSAVTVSGTATLGNIITTNGLFWANGVAFVSGGGASTYSNTNVTAYLTGTVTVGNLITTSGVFWANGVTALGGTGGAYGNTQVAQYLPTYSGSLGGTLTTATQTNITSVGTLTALNVNGTFSGNTAFGDSDPGNYDGTQLVSLSNQTNITGVSFSPTDRRILTIGIGPIRRPFLRTAASTPFELATGNVLVTAGTGSTSSTTGALIVVGGVGVSANISLGGNINLGGSIIPTANVTSNLGDSTHWFNTFYGKAVQAQYADLAEKYIADANYRPGTVVVFGGSAEITLTTEFADVSVAGVISTDPAYLMNAATDGLPVALRGRVPVDVIGRVRKGDLLVTSGSSGYAASVGKNANYGVAVFAKALQDKDDDGVGTIEAVII